MSAEIDLNFSSKHDYLIIKDNVENLLDELYIVCRAVGRDCSECIFADEKKIKWEYGYETDQFVEMCPLDVSLLEWKSSIGRGNRIHPWIIENLDKIPIKLVKLKQELNL